MKQILAITRKELEGYFGSPLAVIFLGVFLAVVLFVFFSVETFFARGIADVRPLFSWMPLLLIFLMAALTMRQWSEEQRSGTFEVLITLPVKPFQLVFGKFLSVMALIIMALALTLPLPITVSQLGNLDWGPVAGGYLAAFLMAAAYAAIGLFISSRTDNQIVALILTILVGGLFYLVGTSGVTDFFGGAVSEILWAIGTGSRFESIERGVIDLRDLIYYLTLSGFFLMLNTISLDSLRWSHKQVGYRRREILTFSLIAVNILVLNVWLYPLQGLRVDLTAQKEYTISQTSKDLLSNLQEPLLIRGYISDKNHPLLTPLKPQIEDMLREYEIAAKGLLTAEVVDPISDPEIEAEANQTYGISTFPFQIEGRYEASVINSYFSILLRYGDQSVVLDYGDLIEVQQTADGVDVTLQNLEYDLTSAIKKVVYGFQSIDSVLAALNEPVTLNYYITEAYLPEELLENDQLVRSVATEIAGASNGKLVFNVTDPDVSSSVDRNTIIQEYGLQPFSSSLFSSDTFLMHLVLENGSDYQIIYPLDEGITEADVRSQIETALKRTSSGFLKKVGIWTQDLSSTTNVYGQTVDAISSYNYIAQQLSGEYTLEAVDLSTGMVPADIDVLVLAAPLGMTDVDLFAVDQYLMRGGSVVLAASDYKVDTDPYYGSLDLFQADGTITEMLASYGINLSSSVVMDPQNEAFPVTTSRDVNGYAVQEIQALDYPYFVDVRSDNMNSDNPIVTNITAVTMNWASPVELDEEKNADRDADVLLYSSEDSWLVDIPSIQPDYDLYPETGFPSGSETQSYPLAVAIRGSFDSFFKGKANPLQEAAAASNEEMLSEEAPGALENELSTTLEKSPNSARLVVFGSNTFIDDFVLQLSSYLNQDRYLNSLQLLQNAVDWSSEDLDLLEIRARGTSTKVLEPLDESQQRFWEITNYVIALMLLLAVYVFWQFEKKNEKPMQLVRSKGENKDGGKS